MISNTRSKILEADSSDEKNVALDLSAFTSSLRSRFKLYMKRAREIEEHLQDRPEEWGKFQGEFNAAVDAIFRDVMNFEKSSMINDSRHKVEKLKNLFIKRFRKLFMRKEYSEWSISKPLGYAGDFKIIDAIYQNNPATTGFNRLFDNYYIMSSVSAGVKNRKDYFKRLIIKYTNGRGKDPVTVMDLASGPGRDVKEILISDELLNKNVCFDMYDHDERALEYSKELLSAFSGKTNFIKVNALRLAASKDIFSIITKKYDVIYSTGLFDYLSGKISVALISNLRKLLKDGGILAIANVRDKSSNPSVHYMEWAGDWNLIYRTDEEFKEYFISAGFDRADIQFGYEQQGIMQYVVAEARKKVKIK